MEAIGIIFLGILLLIIFGIGGWILKLIGYFIEFLFDGCLNGLGCLFWIFIVIILILSLAV